MVIGGLAVKMGGPALAIKPGGPAAPVYHAQRAPARKSAEQAAAVARELLTLPPLEDWRARWEIATEEAGHCCVGQALGGVVGSVEATPSGGAVHFLSLPAGPVENAAIDVAGRQARDPLSIKAALGRGSWSDLRLLLGAGDFNNLVGTKGNSFETVQQGAELARRILAEHAASFEHLRQALIRQPTLTGAEARALFRLGKEP